MPLPCHVVLFVPQFDCTAWPLYSLLGNCLAVLYMAVLHLAVLYVAVMHVVVLYTAVLLMVVLCMTVLHVVVLCGCTANYCAVHSHCT